jgi:hypothetical protein
LLAAQEQSGGQQFLIRGYMLYCIGEGLNIRVGDNLTIILTGKEPRVCYSDLFLQIKKEKLYKNEIYFKIS